MIANKVPYIGGFAVDSLPVFQKWQTALAPVASQDT
jgi:hypothetical protein